MKAKIKVSFGIKFRIKDFEMAEESDGLEIEVEAANETELDALYNKWQSYIQEKVITSAFSGANKFVEEKQKILNE
jgi:hypothetical protein